MFSPLQDHRQYQLLKHSQVGSHITLIVTDNHYYLHFLSMKFWRFSCYDMKICMCFWIFDTYSPFQLIIIFFFFFANPQTSFVRFFWNFACFLAMIWTCAYGLEPLIWSFLTDTSLFQLRISIGKACVWDFSCIFCRVLLNICMFPCYDMNMCIQVFDSVIFDRIMALFDFEFPFA